MRVPVNACATNVDWATNGKWVRFAYALDDGLEKLDLRALDESDDDDKGDDKW